MQTFQLVVYTIIAFCAIAIVAIVIYIIVTIRKKAKDIAQTAFGTDSLVEGFKMQEELTNNSPRSISSADSIYLPLIKNDFPEWSYTDTITHSEQAIQDYLNAIQERNPARVSRWTEEIKNQVYLDLENNNQQGIQECFQNIRIHQTAVFKYIKTPSRCDLIIHSSVEYMYAKINSSQRKPLEETLRKMQTVYSCTWSYIQDITLVPNHISAVSVTCPNCGAPIQMLGSKYCQYCGTGIEPINIRSWKLLQVKKIK